MKATMVRGLALLLVSAGLTACASRASSPEAPQAASATYAGADAAPSPAAPEEKAAEAASEPKKEEPRPAPKRVLGESDDPARDLAEAERLVEQSLARKTVGVKGDGGPTEETGDACSIACRALASMRRSADRVCALAPSASPDAPRCDDAKDRVTKAERRVRERCPGCSATP